MSGVLEGVRLKRSRAWDQIGGLKSDIDAFLREEPAPYVPRIDFNGQTQILTISVHINKSPDTMWSVRIGEIVHNLRSALDHTVWELFIRNNRRPPQRGSMNQFPIFDAQAGFDKRGTGQFLKGISQKAVQLIRAEQPFSVSDGGTGEGIQSPLWHLKELSNCDKHRTIHLTGTLIEKYNFRFSPVTRTLTVHRQETREPGPIQEDAILYRAYFPGVTEWPFKQCEVKAELLTHIAFDQRTPAVGGWLVFDTLVNVANRTDRILRRIAEDIFNIEL